MSKGPLVTRTELRKRREAEEKKQNVVSRKNRSWRKKRISEKKKKFRRFIVKKKKKPINKSRVGEYSKRRERSTWLNKAIIIVAILLAVVAYIVLNL